MTWHPRPFETLTSDLPVRVIIDVGSFRGDGVAACARRYPEAQIWAFEPLAESYAVLAARFAGAANIHVSPLALTDRAGSAALHVSATLEWSSLLATRPAEDGGGPWSDVLEHVHTVTTQTVQADTLDAFCAREGIERVDILNLSVQGGESGVLRGASGLLGSQRIAAVSTDVYFAALYHGQELYRDIEARLAEHGYLLYDLHTLAHAPTGRLRRARAELIAPDVERQLEERARAAPNDPVQVHYVPFGPNVLIVMRVDSRQVDAQAVEVAVNSAPDGSWSGEWTYLPAPPLDADGSTSAIWDTRGYEPGEYLIAINIRLKSGEMLWWGDRPFKTYHLVG